MIVVVESLAKQISVTNRAPYSVRGKRRVASMTVNIPGSSVAEIKLNVVELKLDRLIDALPKINHDRIRYAPAWDRGVSQSERTERTTARKQIHSVVGGRGSRDGKDSFVCSRGSDRCGLDEAFSGNMTLKLVKRD